MHNHITKQSLLALGITLDDATADSLLAHLNQTVEERVGVEITEELDDDQLKELIDLQETANDEQIGAWIAIHVPDYRQIVQDNIDIVIGELAEGTDHINTAA